MYDLMTNVFMQKLETKNSKVKNQRTNKRYYFLRFPGFQQINSTNFTNYTNNNLCIANQPTPSAFGIQHRPGDPLASREWIYFNFNF